MGITPAREEEEDKVDACPLTRSDLQRMQTAPAGTYKGMLHCAGGILKNEGPLAFYKVWCAPRLPAASWVLIRTRRVR